jgi:uncharacterized protein YfkK (UPF0435 family)
MIFAQNVSNIEKKTSMQTEAEEITTIYSAIARKNTF